MTGLRNDRSTALWRLAAGLLARPVKHAAIEGNRRCSDSDWMLDSFQSEIGDLTHRLDLTFAGRSPKIIQFVSARMGEGTSSIARAYALNVVDMLKRRVLLINADSAEALYSHDEDSQPRKIPSMVSHFISSSPIQETYLEINNDFFVAVLSDADTSQNESRWVISNNDFWDAVREDFDEVVIDCPPAEKSRLGLFMASHSDGVVVIVEAERTRGPQVLALLDDLVEMKARIIGTILNKRKMHVPQWIYKLL